MSGGCRPALSASRPDEDHMRDLKIARKYAHTLLEVATEKKKTDKVLADVKSIRTLFNESEDLRRFLDNPLIKEPKKNDILTRIFQGKINDLTLNLLKLLVSKGREKELPGVLDQYEVMLNEQNGIVQVEVTSAVKLDKKQEKMLLDRLAQITGKKPELVYRIDKAVIGGFVARIGDTIIDGSVRRQLERLKERFSKASQIRSN